MQNTYTLMAQNRKPTRTVTHGYEKSSPVIQGEQTLTKKRKLTAKSAIPSNIFKNSFPTSHPPPEKYRI